MKDIFDDVAAFNTEAVIEVVGWWRQCTVQVFTFSTPLFLNWIWCFYKWSTWYPKHGQFSFLLADKTQQKSCSSSNISTNTPGYSNGLIKFKMKVTVLCSVCIKNLINMKLWKILHWILKYLGFDCKNQTTVYKTGE